MYVYFFKHTKLNWSVEKTYELFLFCMEINTRKTFQFYNILSYNTSDARMSNASPKKLPYKTILIWLRVLKCRDSLGDNVLFSL